MTEISTADIRQAIAQLRSNHVSGAMYFGAICPVPQWRLNYKTYKRRGRPRKSDYVFVDLANYILKYLT